jgi:hypothetical protein
MHIPAAGGRRRRRKITTFSGFWDPTKSYIYLILFNYLVLGINLMYQNITQYIFSAIPKNLTRINQLAHTHTQQKSSQHFAI